MREKWRKRIHIYNLTININNVNKYFNKEIFLLSVLNVNEKFNIKINKNKLEIGY